MLIAIGFWLLSRGSITMAPLLLVLGYCVLIPIGILLPTRERKTEGDTMGRFGVGQ